MFVPVAKILKRYRLEKVFYLMLYLAILGCVAVLNKEKALPSVDPQSFDVR